MRRQLAAVWAVARPWERALLVLLPIPGSFDEVLGVKEVVVRHDTLDYLGAVGGAVGGLSAIVALILARKSANDAKDALVLQRSEAAAAEAERARRADPVAQVSARAFGTSDDAPPGHVVLTVGISNEDGAREAEGCVVNVLMSDQLTIAPCGDADGNGSGKGQVLHSDESLGGHPGVSYWAYEPGSIGKHVYRVGWLLVDRPPPGEHRVKVRISHDDLPSGDRDREWNLHVPEQGNSVTLEDVIDAETEAGEKSPT